MLSTWEACCPTIKQRWIFVFMAFMALWIGNSLRVVISITIVNMVYPIEESLIEYDETCIGNIRPAATNSTNSSVKVFAWDEYTQGLILSSYFWGYAITQFPFGRLSERYGGKYLLGLSVLIPSILTLIVPVCVEWMESTALIILRMLMGAFSGAMFPAASAMIASWSAPKERTKFGTLVYAGAITGTIFGTTMPAVIISYSSTGWPKVFHWFGILGISWFPLWILLCYNNPEEHPYISQSELDYLRESLKSQKQQKTKVVPWVKIFTSKQFWAFVIALTGCDWAYYTMASDLPKYMDSVVKFTIEDNGYLSALPFFSMWMSSFLCSWILDKIVKKNCLTLTNSRKLFATISLMGPAIFIIAASYAECNRKLVVVMFIIGLTTMGAAYPSIMVNTLDLSPNYSGTLMAVGNGIAALGGIMTPYIVGVLTPNQTIDQWRLVFWIVFVVAVLSNAYYLFYGSAEIQEWNDSTVKDSDTIEKAQTIKEPEFCKEISNEIVRC